MNKENNNNTQNIILEINGLEYQIATDKMELETDIYMNAWKIVKQKPTNYKEYLMATMYARAHTNQNRLGCGYTGLSEKIQKTFNVSDKFY
jgi:hypothetical protein